MARALETLVARPESDVFESASTPLGPDVDLGPNWPCPSLPHIIGCYRCAMPILTKKPRSAAQFMSAFHFRVAPISGSSLDQPPAQFNVVLAFGVELGVPVERLFNRQSLRLRLLCSLRRNCFSSQCWRRMSTLLKLGFACSWIFIVSVTRTCGIS